MAKTRLVVKSHSPVRSRINWAIALLMVLLTSFMQVSAVLLAWRVERHVSSFFALLLLLEAGLMGIFLAYDLVLFYLFWEVALIPMFFLISVWGGVNRRLAALKFFLYTLVGSLLFLVGILVLYFQGGETFDILTLMEQEYPFSIQAWVFLAFLVAFDAAIS